MLDKPCRTTISMHEAAISPEIHSNYCYYFWLGGIDSLFDIEVKSS